LATSLAISPPEKVYDLIKSFTFNPSHGQLFDEIGQSPWSRLGATVVRIPAASTEIISSFSLASKGTMREFPFHFKASMVPERVLPSLHSILQPRETLSDN
jgi:hypothetical protein